MTKKRNKKNKNIDSCNLNTLNTLNTLNNSNTLNHSNTLSNCNNITDNKKSNITTKIDNNITNIECCICFLDKWQVLTPCKHVVCVRCLFTIKNECPICRNKLFNDKDFPDFLKPKLESSLEKTSHEIYEDNFPPLG